ncbi:hypothetical protein [Actinomadura rupiterrae]|uniref:hypothetical protein n=1 Tax=Actinomadura rupiterrae TaxID=559627 RepID=UPI0020A4FB27|nr:hypothetical protein [Actinomadura rupiterrae]MCP2337273.1 hypothetical protein [Actinomadura rupiterrae]
MPYPAEPYPAEPYPSAPAGYDPAYPAGHAASPPPDFGHPPTELDAGYSSPPTAYDAGTPSADPGAAYGPPPEPWGGAEQQGWQAAPPPPPAGPPGEHTITLSPEPWAAEPQVWSPPPPQKKKPPYLLIATGLVVLAAVALGIVFWPTGSSKANRAGDNTPTTPQQTQSATTQSQPSDTPSTQPSSPSPSGDLQAQAGKVNALLDQMASTRSELQSVLTGGCETSGLEQIRGERQTQLSTAQGLEVSALDNGQQLKDALVRALEASVASNQKYISLSPGCPSDDDVADVNQQATDAKREFIGYWNQVAGKANLSPRTEAGI